MRFLISSVYLLAASRLLAQSSLEAVFTNVDHRNGQFIVNQTFRIAHEGPSTSIELKALKFGGSFLGSIKANTNEYVELHTDDLITIKLDDYQLDSIELTYTIEPTEELAYLPLFFSNLSAASSDDDFFKIDLNSPSDKFIHIYFPTVELIRSIKSESNVVSFELPALISGVRLEVLNDNEAPGNLVAVVDWGVGVLFVGIGFLVWYHRKKLIHG